VSGLLCWLGVWKLGIVGLHVYMDDFFGWDYADNLVWFRGKLRPRRQVQFLLLWESISCPFEDCKQEHGETLKIIGFWVDINAGSLYPHLPFPMLSPKLIFSLLHLDALHPFALGNV
jgi:hypothetical protein